MAHVKKYTRGTMGRMLAHYNRTKASSTSLIDPARTPLNYNLSNTDQPLSQLDFIHKRLSEIKVLNRKDVNVFCDWIVAAPQELSENEYVDFFKDVYKFLNDRYGKENVISAYVHMDESQPHIHYAFVPVAIDKKKNIPKLSAKEVITLKELKSFHKDLSNHLNEFFGRDIGILNGATDLGNHTIKQLRNKKGSLKNYADTEIQTTTNIITKAMGKDKVIVSKMDIEAAQQAAALERQNRNVSMNNAIASEDISNRLKICQEWEQQLELCENSPHKFYGDKIAKLNEENSTLKNDISELKSDNNRIQENVTLLNQQIAEKEKSFSKRLADKEREVAANYENRLREKDSIIKSLNSTIDGLKATVEKAYRIICNICRAAAALWCGKGKFADYCADFTPKQNALMCAILDYGAKCTREADFPDLSNKIDTEYYISENIREEMEFIEPNAVQPGKDYYSR